MDPMEKLQQLLKDKFADRIATFPPEVKAAMEKTRVDLARKPGRIEISIDSQGDAGVEAFREVFLDSLLTPLCGMITIFGCQSNVEVDMPQTPDEDADVKS